MRSKANLGGPTAQGGALCRRRVLLAGAIGAGALATVLASRHACQAATLRGGPAKAAAAGSPVNELTAVCVFCGSSSGNRKEYVEVSHRR
jgi:hypothetical protein